jgi:hypothetical protein
VIYTPPPRPTRLADAAVTALLRAAGAVALGVTLAIVYVVLVLVLP